MRREEDHIVRLAMNFEVEGGRPAGRPKKPWRQVLEEDVRVFNINEGMTRDRSQWRQLIGHPTT